MSLLRWVDEIAKVKRGKLKIWTNPGIPGITSTKLSKKKNNETIDNKKDKKCTGDLLEEVCLDVICNHLNKMFSGKDVYIPSKLLTEEKQSELAETLQFLRNNNELSTTDKTIIVSQIAKRLAEGNESSAVASEVLSSFSDKKFLKIAMLPENLTLESMFASQNLQESWTFIKLCDLIGKNPKKFAKQIKTQPKLRDGLVKEVAESMKELLICRTPYKISDPELTMQYYNEGMLFDGHEQITRNMKAKEKERLYGALPSHLGIIRHLVKSQLQTDQEIYNNFLQQLDRYKKNASPNSTPPQLPSIDHHPTDIQAISIAKTSRSGLVKLLKTHPDKNLLKMSQNKHYPNWYIVRKIIEADNQSRNTFTDAPEKGRDVLEWGNKHLPRNKPYTITAEDAHKDFTSHLSNYWYEESFNRASILFDLTNTDRLIFRQNTESDLKSSLQNLNAAKDALETTAYEERKTIEREKKDLIRGGSTLGLPRSSMLSLLADHELLPISKTLQQQAIEYSKKSPKCLPEQVAAHILKAANRKNFFTGLNPKVYDQEKLYQLIALVLPSPDQTLRKQIVPKSNSGQRQQRTEHPGAHINTQHKSNLPTEHVQPENTLPSTQLSEASLQQSFANEKLLNVKQLARKRPSKNNNPAKKPKLPETNTLDKKYRLKHGLTRKIPTKFSQPEVRARPATSKAATWQKRQQRKKTNSTKQSIIK